MRIVVQKYGGSSVATPDKLRAVARRVVDAQRGGLAVVAVVSAMGDATDELIALARQVSENPDPRELDVLLSTGETVSSALLALAIRDLGASALSFSGAACGVRTNDVHGNARILSVNAARMRAALAQGAIVVAAGFQGVSPSGEATTLGRGGSDTTAVALAAALQAERCEIYTDVDGVFSADPRLVPHAVQLDALDSTELEALAWCGAQVVKAEAVEFAAGNGVPVLVASAFGSAHGTLVHPDGDARSIFHPRRDALAGVTGRHDLLWVRLAAHLGDAARAAAFGLLARHDLIFGDVGRAGGAGELFVSTQDMPNQASVAAELRALCGDAASVEGDLGAVSLVGFGLGSRPGALFDAASRLEACGARVRRSFTGRESLTFVLGAREVDACVRALYEAYFESQPRNGPAPAAESEASVGREA